MNLLLLCFISMIFLIKCNVSSSSIAMEIYESSSSNAPQMEIYESKMKVNKDRVKSSMFA